jgi:hypothetical protein
LREPTITEHEHSWRVQEAATSKGAADFSLLVRSAQRHAVSKEINATGAKHKGRTESVDKNKNISIEEI